MRGGTDHSRAACKRDSYRAAILLSAGTAISLTDVTAGGGPIRDFHLLREALLPYCYLTCSYTGKENRKNVSMRLSALQKKKAVSRRPSRSAFTTNYGLLGPAFDFISFQIKPRIHCHRPCR